MCEIRRMVMLIVFFASAVLLPGAAGHPPAQPFPARIDPRVNSLARPLVGAATPGLGLVVVFHGQVIHAAAYGVRDIASQAPLTASTPFYIASLAKMFTALGVLDLVEKGHASLDTRASVLLADMPAYARKVTIRQMLNHTSGLIDHYDAGGEDRLYTREDVMQVLQEAGALRYEPGTKSSYSNSAYVLLARIIEKLTGESYAEFVRRRFFARADMINARVVNAPADLPPARARGYTHQDGAFVLNDYQGGNAPGAGGVYASLNDLYHWALALRDGKVVSSDVLKTASTPTILSTGRDTEWGMGWLAESHGRKDKLSGRRYVAAVGSFRGFRALFKWYQEDDLVIIELANSDDDTVFDTLEQLPRLILLPALNEVPGKTGNP